MSSSHLRQIGQWKRPLDDYLKLNVNRALFFNRNKVKLDWQQAYLRRVFDLENVELTAIFRELQLCARIGIHMLILDSDCLFMIKECLSSATSFSTIGSLIT